jgi:hypothetical protein
MERGEDEYLASTKQHCKTPAMPVQVDGVAGCNASWTSRPTEPESDTKAITYAMNSQVLDLKPTFTSEKLMLGA